MPRTKTESLKRRHLRIRRKVVGTTDRPRLCIHKSLKHIYAQIVDDASGRTLCFVTTNKKELKNEAKSFCNQQWAEKLGQEVAGKAREQGVESVVFDRGGYRYHGIIKTFADAAREGGLKF